MESITTYSVYNIRTLETSPACLCFRDYCPFRIELLPVQDWMSRCYLNQLIPRILRFLVQDTSLDQWFWIISDPSRSWLVCISRRGAKIGQPRWSRVECAPTRATRHAGIRHVTVSHPVFWNLYSIDVYTTYYGYVPYQKLISHPLTLDSWFTFPWIFIFISAEISGNLSLSLFIHH